MFHTPPPIFRGDGLQGHGSMRSYPYRYYQQRYEVDDAFPTFLSHADQDNYSWSGMFYIPHTLSSCVVSAAFTLVTILL